VVIELASGIDLTNKNLKLAILKPIGGDVQTAEV
jgi:hypothetical protein